MPYFDIVRVEILNLIEMQHENRYLYTTHAYYVAQKYSVPNHFSNNQINYALVVDYE